jgi:flagellar protein FliO/FliZ
MSGTTPSALLFKPKSERRLEVVDHASLDGRRKLVLIRRDDVEHLLMTGGPVDVVIETGISSAARRGSETAVPQEGAVTRRSPMFARNPEPVDPGAGGREL